MNKATSIIEINGNRYDAVTGQLAGAAKKAAHQIKRPLDSLSIDGFTKPAKAIKRSAVKRSVHATHRKPERSRTLMRGGVKSPAHFQPEDKISSRSLLLDHARASRATNVSLDSKVNRFGALPSSRSEAKTGEVIGPHKPLPQQRSAAVSAAMPAVISNASHNRLERLLDLALVQADSHKQALNKSKRAHRRLFGRVPRWLAVSLTIIVIGSVIGFVVWHKVPQASLKLAAVKAHVNASLPTPISGYKIGPIAATEHAVTTTVQSKTDSSKKYTVTEQPSTQPAASLADTAGNANGGPQVQTVQDQDKTYILSQDGEKSIASCIKGGNTITVLGIGLTVPEQTEAIKSAC